MSKALLVIDVQKDFGTGGALAVPDAEAIVPVINDLMPRFAIVVASQDWHPPNHVSFAARHGKRPGEEIAVGGMRQPLFAAHCLQNSPGAQFIEGLHSDRFAAVFKKGTNEDMDSFSAFKDNAGAAATGMESFLRESGATDLYLCGLATDYCVMSTALDAVEAGFAVTVVRDACRPLDSTPASVERVFEKLSAAGVRICTSADVMTT